MTAVGLLRLPLLLLPILALVLPQPAHAEAPLAQQLTRWLDEPGVRVVAVEVYSDYCEPCKAAAPRWERLRQRYAGQGLKLVVINIDPYEGDTRRCKSLPWRPDLLKCSPDLAEQLGVQAVPQAFVWSWQGNLLVQGKTHIAEVERVVGEYFDSKNPRVVVEAVGGDDKARKKLRRLLEDALGRDDKLTLVTDGAARARLAKLRRSSHDLARRQDQQCEAGQEISPNMRLVVEDFGDTMSLSLQDIESGACSLTVTADTDGSRPGRSARKAVYELLGRLRRRPPQMPSGARSGVGGAPPPPVAAGPTFGGGQVTAALGRMRIEGKPRGARVEVSGPKGFERALALPATLERLEPGAYTLSVAAQGHVAAQSSTRVRADETALVRVILELPGGIEVRGEPTGALVELFAPGGAELFAKSFPLTGDGLPPGTYRVRVTRPGYDEYDQPHEVRAGRTTAVSVTLRHLPPAATSSATSSAAASGGRPDIEWVRLAGGRFERGSTRGDADEGPVRTVRVPTFEIAKTEVTVAQYRACVQAGACTAPRAGAFCNWGEAGRDDHPVNCVDWRQAGAFSAWAGGRLPSEAEWEYAARSGGRPITYPWGDEEATCGRAVMDEGGDGCGQDRTWSVCSKPQGSSRQGVCDLAGNVWEWVQDCYGGYEDAPSNGQAETGCSAGAYRVYRGGGWGFGATRLRAANRSRCPPTNRGSDLGFRPARSVP